MMAARYGIQPPGFRLPEDTQVGRVRLQVADLARSLEYYTTVLGLTPLAPPAASDSKAARTASLGADGKPLVELVEKQNIQRAPHGGAFGLYHFAILLPDRSALGRFLTHLSSLNARVGMADHLVSEALYLTDPDGLGIEVYADRPRETWQHNGRELAMTTDPLNVRSVMAAGEGRPWDSMPAGTTIGHVHLHVGDLEQAEAFYHGALGLDKMVWTYPGALFLAAGGYHHHLGTNTWSPGPSASDDQARLLHWELSVGGEKHASAAAESLRAAGYDARLDGTRVITSDPWGTELHLTE